MDVNDLMKLDRPLTDDEMTFMERELLHNVRELGAEIDRITKDLDPDDPIVAKLRASPRKIEHSVEQAIACRNEATEDDPYKPTLQPPVYTWEKLPAYEWINSFARVVGRLLAVLPRRLQIHAHNLAGQTTLISNCIAMGHRDTAPGDVVAVEELRAYRTIAYHATFTVMDMLEEISKLTKLGGSDVAKGRALTGQLREQFERDLADLNGGERNQPVVVH